MGIFLDRLRALGMFDNTLIVFMSDHGEPLGEGMWGHGIMRKARPWPYEELVHVPLIIRHPEGIGGGERRAAFVQPPDIMPTALDFLEVPWTGAHARSEPNSDHVRSDRKDSRLRLLRVLPKIVESTHARLELHLVAADPSQG